MTLGVDLDDDVDYGDNDDVDLDDDVDYGDKQRLQHACVIGRLCDDNCGPQPLSPSGKGHPSLTAARVPPGNVAGGVHRPRHRPMLPGSVSVYVAHAEI